MQTKYYFSALFASAALLFASCNNQTENAPAPEEDGPAVLKIVLQGEVPSNADEAKASGALPEESAVKNFHVYVFNAENMTLEDMVSVTTPGETTATISGLSTGFPKHVVVAANIPTTFPIFNQGDEYEQFTTAAAAINLPYQSPANVATNGLSMIGESAAPININPTGVTTATIDMRRLAARVQLGNIQVLPAEDTEYDEFKITGVSIQRAYANSDLFGNPVNPTTMFGGIASLGNPWNNTQQSFLYDALSATFTSATYSQNFNNYFYVFPNQSADSCTLLTLVSTYKGDEQYFPIKINATQSSGSAGDTTDGTFIRSNMTYTINITVNNLNEGTTDPDIPPTEGTLEVTVGVIPWEMNIKQNVIW